MSRRVVITSIGAISALGNTPETIAGNLHCGRAGFEPSPHDPSVPVCPISNFELSAHTGRFKNRRYLNRGAALATAAAMQALDHARLPTDMRTATGLIVGGGPNLDIGGEFPDITEGEFGGERLSALWLLRFLPNTAASAIAQLAGLHGENLTIGTACSASLQAIGEAFRKVKDGYLDVALAGGGDSRLSAGGILAYKKAQALYAGELPPDRASRPFDERRAGFVPGEGGAFVVVEELGHARRRGADIWAELLGYGAALDAYNMTAPQPDGRWAEQAVRGALSEAALRPEDIDMVSAHGTGTPLNDAMEAALIQRIYPSAGPDVLAYKSWVGHLASACGAMETVLCLIGMRQGRFPPIRNLETPCSTGVNFLRKASTRVPEALLVENFGFGGQNSALVIKKWTT